MRHSKIHLSDLGMFLSFMPIAFGDQPTRKGTPLRHIIYAAPTHIDHRPSPSHPSLHTILIVCIAEKPSVARDIANILGATVRRTDKGIGHYEGNGYAVTWTSDTSAR